jgi:hypothetical protein
LGSVVADGSDEVLGRKERMIERDARVLNYGDDAPVNIAAAAAESSLIAAKISVDRRSDEVSC